MDAGDFALSDREFARVQARIRGEAGIALSEAKRTLVMSRLGKLIRALGLTSFDAYLDYLEVEGTQADAQDFINALTTNLTRFFREEHHFDHLVAHVGGLMRRRPRLSEDGRPRLRIWSAGCSTGQEPYTIALCLLAAYPELRHWDFRILATDVDTSVLARAEAGVYPAAELSGLTAQQAALFERGADGSVVVPVVARAAVAFRPLNLMAKPWPMRGRFDAVFCRNVTIYFDRATQTELFARLGRILTSDGMLYVGHAESLGAGGDGFRLVGKTVYQPRQPHKARDAA